MPHHHSSSAHAPHTEGHTIHWARFYDLLAWLLSLGRRDSIAALTLDAAQVQLGDRLLDVGCGTGSVTLAALDRVGATGEVVGIDPSAGMIVKAAQKARGRTPSPRFELAAIEELPFETASFDRATAQLMFHHLPEDLRRAGLAEVRRVLKPGATLALADFASLEGSALTHLLGLTRRGKQRRAPWLTTLLEDAGFEDVEQVPTQLGRMAFVRGRAPKAP